MKEFYMDQKEIDHFSRGSHFHKYFRYKWLFLSSFIICFLACFAYIKMKAPLYGIYASIVIKDEKKGEPSDFPFRDIDVFNDQNTVDNESEIIRSKTIITSVTGKMDLNIDYYSREYFFKKTPLNYSSPVVVEIRRETEEMYEEPLRVKLADTLSYVLLNNGRTYRYGETVNLSGSEFSLYKTPFHHSYYEGKIIEIAVKSLDEAAQAIRSNLSVAQTNKNASMLNLSLLHPVPAQGVDILNAVIQEYHNINHRYRASQTEVAVNIIQERLDLLTGELDTIENKAQKYKSRMGITTLSADAQLLLDKAKESDNRIIETRIKAEVLGSIEKYALGSPGSPMPPTTGLNDPVLLNLLTRVNDLELERSELISTLGPENSKVRTKNVQIGEIRKGMLENIRVQKQNVQSALNRLIDEKKQIEAEIRSVPVNERNLTKIVRQKNIHENIYNYLLQKREEANISAASEYSKLRVIDSSYSSVKPVRPNKLITFFAGLLFAIALPIIAVNIRETFNKRLSDPAFLNTVNVPVIGEIGWDRRSGSTRFMENGHSFISEQFRILMTRLKSEDPGCKTILITSSEPAEGKSYISTHLAEVLAAWDRKVILVDADLRKGKLGRELNIDPGTMGLSDYLINQGRSIDEIVYRFSHVENAVDVITSGNRKPGIFKLLGGERLKQLFECLQERYEYIIINTPPVRLVSDALLLAKYAEITLYVVRNGYTLKNNLRYIPGLNEKGALGKMYLILNGSADFQRNTRKYKEYFEAGKTV